MLSEDEGPRHGRRPGSTTSLCFGQEAVFCLGARRSMEPTPDPPLPLGSGFSLSLLLRTLSRNRRVLSPHGAQN